MSVYLPESMQKLYAKRREEALQLSRRGFIKVTTLAGGGFMLALSLGPAAEKALAQTKEAADTTLNPYVHVRSDGKIVLFAKNPEVGQGVKTSLPLIVAEELDADWNQVEVRQSVISAEMYGLQLAGGSTSIPMNFDTLRRAGATARAMLVAAAARNWNVPVAELRTEKSVVHHDESGRTATYSELAAAAATLPVPAADSVKLKPKSAYRLLGKRVSGVDNEKIVRGEPLFGIDQRVPGMLFATFTKSPAIGGRAVSANLDHIRTLPGVKNAFIVAEHGNPLLFDLSGAPAVLSGVAIVANTTWSAMQAKKALQVKWDESNASHDSWKTAVTEARRLAAQPPAEVLGQAGNVDAALAEHTPVEAFYTYHYVSHADLEPQNCTAWFKGDSVEIWAPTQTPQSAVDAIANLLGLPKDKVLLHQLRGGGGFGRRLANDSVCEAVLVSKQAGGIPVKVQWMREDDMGFDYYRSGGFQSFKAAIDKSGKLAAYQNHFIGFTMDGKQPVSAGNIDKAEFPANVLGTQRMAQSLIPSKIPTGPWRAPGSNVNAFCIQSFLNECAVAAKRDYPEFLIELMGTPRALPPDPFGGVFHTGRAVNVIKAAAERSGWGRKLPAGRGLGLAFHFSHQGHFAEVAEVSVDASKKVTVHKVWVVADIGPIVNLSSAENQCQGSVVDAISTAMGLKITFENGRAEQTNFDKYPIIRIDKAPLIDVHFLDTDYPPTGCGEPAFPPVAPAIANAIFAATGQRPRTLPFNVEGYSI
ncbi:MAG TPA: molybdopterin cofactor-binding domain-containing protein [Gammaproteobacteria bacterium]|nr:molybdopterin cofactor-binding domain-containing protein [Gammaproteobacteria bacterium]